jgi:hypothetical protein
MAMDVHIRVDLDDEGPVVVKSATGAAVERLTRERRLLERAVHPGVVSLAGTPGGDPAELRTRYAGEPVERWTGSLAAVAGLGAAVASTLADIHDLGIVHGRLDATHILIGDDGRPRLCGLSHPGGAAPADDVAALGAVLDRLVEHAPAERRRLMRLGDRAGGDRRALRLVVDRAADAIPTRRPTARAMAEALLAAAPGASLPTATDARGGPSTAGVPRSASAPGAATRHTGRLRSAPGDLGTGRPGGAAVADDRRRPEGTADADDTGWPGTGGRRDGGEEAGGGVGTGGGAGRERRDEPDTLDRIWAFAGDETDDERWAAALGTGPPDLPAAAGRDDTSRLPMAEIDTPAWSSTRVDDTAPLPHPIGTAGVLDDPRPSVDGSADRRDEPAGTRRPYDDPADAWPDEEPGESGRYEDQLTRDHLPAAGRVTPGRRPPRRSEPGPTTRRRRRRLAAGAAGLTIVALVTAGVTVIGSGGGADAPRPEPSVPDDDCPDAAGPAADIDGDGCPEVLAVEGDTVDAGVARWSLGEPGDLVTVGDWDCDGEASAALLRPSSGDVFVFSAWADQGEPVTVSSTRRVDGGVGIRAEPGDQACDRLVIDLAGGGSAPVEVGG